MAGGRLLHWDLCMFVCALTCLFVLKMQIIYMSMLNLEAPHIFSTSLLVTMPTNIHAIVSRITPLLYMYHLVQY